MSDDELKFVKKQKTIHYGSLEDSEFLRPDKIEASNEAEKIASLPAANGKKSHFSFPNLLTITFSTEYMELEDAMSRDKQALLEEFERRRKARSINVSTDDAEVKRNLRQLSEPIVLFGEGPADRRNRLRELLSRMGEDTVIRREAEEERKQFEKDQETTWYHEGPESLRIARLWIAEYSLPRAKERLEEARRTTDTSSATKTAKFQELQKSLQIMSIYSSQVGDTRPISYCQFSPNSKFLATASW